MHKLRLRDVGLFLLAAALVALSLWTVVRLNPPATASLAHPGEPDANFARRNGTGATKLDASLVGLNVGAPWSGSSGGGGGGSTATNPAVIWRPGGVQGGNVVTSWPQVQQAITATQGALTVYVDSSLSPATVTAGSQAVTHCNGAATFAAYDQTNGADAASGFDQNVMTIADGATLDRPRGFASYLTVLCASATTPCLTFTQNAAGFDTLTLQTSTFAMTPGASLAGVAVTGSVAVNLLDLAVLGLPAEGAAVFALSTTDAGAPTLVLNAVAASQIDPSTVSGTTGTINFSHDDTIVLSATYFPSFSGSYAEDRFSLQPAIEPSAVANLPDSTTYTLRTGQPVWSTTLAEPCWWTGTAWTCSAITDGAAPTPSIPWYGDSSGASYGLAFLTDSGALLAVPVYPSDYGNAVVLGDAGAGAPIASQTVAQAGFPYPSGTCSVSPCYAGVAWVNDAGVGFNAGYAGSSQEYVTIGPTGTGVTYSPALSLHVQAFTSTTGTTYTPANTGYATGCGCGGGGGGGGGSLKTGGSGGGGGGALWSCKPFATTATVGITVTVGTGGSGGAGSATTASPGGGGTDSTIGSLVSFLGASGGGGGTSSTGGMGGLASLISETPTNAYNAAGNISSAAAPASVFLAGPATGGYGMLACGPPAPAAGYPNPTRASGSSPGAAGTGSMGCGGGGGGEGANGSGGAGGNLPAGDASAGGSNAAANTCAGGGGGSTADGLGTPVGGAGGNGGSGYVLIFDFKIPGGALAPANDNATRAGRTLAPHVPIVDLAAGFGDG
jgi:hypothetical protein